MRQAAKIAIALGTLTAISGAAHLTGLLQIPGVPGGRGATATEDVVVPPETSRTAPTPPDAERAPEPGQIPTPPAATAAASANAEPGTATPEPSPSAAAATDSKPASAEASVVSPDTYSARSAARVEPIVPPVKRTAPKTPPVAAEPAGKMGEQKPAKAAASKDADKAGKKK